MCCTLLLIIAHIGVRQLWLESLLFLLTVSIFLQVWLGRTLQKLDSLLLGVCQQFKEESYITVSISLLFSEKGHYFLSNFCWLKVVKVNFLSIFMCNYIHIKLICFIWQFLFVLFSSCPNFWLIWWGLQIGIA